MKFLKIMGALFLMFVLVGVAVVKLNPSFGKSPNSKQFINNPNYKNGKFQNPVNTQSMNLGAIPEVSKKYFFRKVEHKPLLSYQFNESNKYLDSANQTFTYNWLGHASVLMKIGNTTILTDPILTQKASPFSFMGPSRFFKSPIAIAKLPKIDAVIISHDHYDHLDFETIVALKNNVDKFIVPLAVSGHLLRWGIDSSKIIELDWWETISINQVEITSTPARHFSGRLFTQNNTFWTSYAIVSQAVSIYFGGDSGMFPGYTEIGEKFNGFDVAFIPIGAYDNAWQNIHLNPEEAIAASKMIKAKLAIPIHWGTFDLALHSWYEPAERFIEEAEKNNFPVIIPTPGEWLNIHSKKNNRWYRQFSKKWN